VAIALFAALLPTPLANSSGDETDVLGINTGYAVVDDGRLPPDSVLLEVLRRLRQARLAKRAGSSSEAAAMFGMPLESDLDSLRQPFHRPEARRVSSADQLDK
ncbi:hypothetical protein BOX15_Mlig007163g3, partial [Macrostomum lignano]